MGIGESFHQFKEYAIRGGVKVPSGACFSMSGLPCAGVIHSNIPENLDDFEHLLRKDGLWHSNEGILVEWDAIEPLSAEGLRSQPNSN